VAGGWVGGKFRWKGGGGGGKKTSSEGYGDRPADRQHRGIRVRMVKKFNELREPRGGGKKGEHGVKGEPYQRE